MAQESANDVCVSGSRFMSSDCKLLKGIRVHDDYFSCQ